MSFRSVSIVDIYGNFMEVIVRGAVAQGKSFRCNCLGGGGRFGGLIVLGGDFIGGNCPWGNYSGAVV